MTAYVGGSARFDCSIKATPPAAIVWQKDNAQLAIDDHRYVATGRAATTNKQKTLDNDVLVLLKRSAFVCLWGEGWGGGAPGKKN